MLFKVPGGTSTDGLFFESAAETSGSPDRGSRAGRRESWDAGPLLHRFHNQPMSRLWNSLAEFLQAFQIQVQRFAGVMEGFIERLTAGDDVGNVAEVHDVRRVLGFVGHREDIAAILMRRFHRPALSVIAEYRRDGRSCDRRGVSQSSALAHQLDGRSNDFLAD